jgi:hypothetical protein
MDLHVIHHKKPNLNKIQFNCDNPLSRHLSDDPLLRHLNKTFFALFLGSKGSGKSSLLLGLLTTKHKWKKCFHRVYVFAPSNSRASVDKDPYSELPEDQKFDEVTSGSLNYVYEQLLENKEHKMNSLLIFDDVQAQLKDNEQLLLHIVNNARHLMCSVVILAQNYRMTLSKPVRIKADALFLFNLSKTEYVSVYEEYLEMSKAEFSQIMRYYTEQKKKDENRYSFLYFDKNGNIFMDWNQIVLDNSNNTSSLFS